MKAATTVATPPTGPAASAPCGHIDRTFADAY